MTIVEASEKCTVEGENVLLHVCDSLRGALGGRSVRVDGDGWRLVVMPIGGAELVLWLVVEERHGAELPLPGPGPREESVVYRMPAQEAEQLLRVFG